MLSILAAVDAAITRVIPQHSIPFYELAPLLLPPSPTYLVHVETLAGLRTTLTNLTPKSTIRHVQCAYRATQLTNYLATKHLDVPPSFRQKVAGELYEAGYVPSPNFWIEEVSITDPKLLQAIKDGPTDFKDTFAVQLCALSSLDKQIQFSTRTLGQLGLASKTPLTLTVTIRPDRAEYDAAHPLSKASKQRLCIRDHYLADGNLFGICCDRVLMYESVCLNGCAFGFASAALRNDYDIAMTAVQQAGCVLKYASEDLRKNRELVMTAVQQAGCALKYASEELQHDRELVLAAVKQDGSSLAWASRELKYDDEVVLEAVRCNGCALYHAPYLMRADHEIVMAAIRQTGMALQYTSEELRNDRDIVLVAMRETTRALKYASWEIRKERSAMLASV
jgi:hypothetical protein